MFETQNPIYQKAAKDIVGLLKIIEQAHRRIDQIVEWHTNCFIMTLLDNGYIEANSVQAILDKTSDLYDSLVQGYLTFEDLHDTLRKEYGLNLRMKKG